MATPDLTRLLTGFQGSLVANPTNLTPPAYGGTPLGEIMDLVVTPRRRAKELTAEEYGGETIEVVDGGESWKFTSAIRGVDPDLYGLIMSVPASQGAPSGRPLVTYPGTQTQAGAFLSQRTSLPLEILLVPKDVTRLPAFVFFAVIPVLDASARLTLQLDREGAFGAVFYCLRANASGQPQDKQVVQWGMIEDLVAAVSTPLPPLAPAASASWINLSAPPSPPITPLNSGNTYTNLNATGEIDVPLPAGGSVGDTFAFVCEAAFVFKIVAAGGQTIALGTLTSVAGGYVETAVVTSVLILRRATATSWVGFGGEASWSVDS